MRKLGLIKGFDPLSGKELVKGLYLYERRVSNGLFTVINPKFKCGSKGWISPSMSKDKTAWNFSQGEITLTQPSKAIKVLYGFEDE